MPVRSLSRRILSMSSQKGIKYAKGKRVDAPDELSYDALEEEAKSDRSKLKRKSNNASLDETEGSSKKRGSNVSSMSIASNKSSTSNKSSKSSKSATSTKTTQKHHYPTTQFELSDELRDQVINNVQHGELLGQLVHDIASQEFQALDAHFSSAASKSISGRKYIFESLGTVLSDLVSFVEQDCPNNATFEAEDSKAAVAEMKSLQQTKKLLQQHSDKLQVFEDNMATLAEAHDLWVGADAITQKVKAAVKAPSAPSAVQETVGAYTQLLQALERDCAAIIEATAGTRSVMQTARQTQDALYDAASKVRLEHAGRAKAPSDAKDLLKKMPALF